MAFHQAQADGVCLRHPDVLGVHQNLTHEAAVNLLIRSITIAQTTPFVWGYIDRPTEGQLYLVFMAPALPFPVDGIRYQEQEQRYSIPVGSGRELEIMEVKFGFIPGMDQTAFRVRRRYRFSKAGPAQLVLVHYSRGPSMPVIPTLMNQPIRQYPLRNYNEPAVYVMGERQGQKLYPNAPGGIPPGADRMQPMPPSAIGAGFGNPQAMLAQQSNNMEALERRSQRERDRSGSVNTAKVQSEVEVLQAKAASRQAAREAAQLSDVSMDGLSAPISEGMQA
ncbi:hypothetical protein PHLCEN_2v13222 [Hermanssonia centrifuga]|uniref:SWI/SNF and RSC complexes subunit Ssr4 N-terminal domain-containing protein n=1 Tax=Hermanssonia centrifuga TaxID=98765 RepID=A0A2R6NF72_9APHY|nr:hypothetical protein PHLCEN_2v13222 [Hermanssonia centrifuga]